MSPDQYYGTYTQPQPTSFFARNKRVILWAIITAVLIALFSVFWWFYTHAYIAVRVDNAGGDRSITYTIIDKDGTASKVTSQSSTFKTMVSKGNYQVLVTADDKSYVTAVSSGSFLQTTDVTAELRDESARRFVGNNPGSCMYYPTNVLISGQCGGVLAELNRHVPATATTPSYVETLPTATIDYAAGTQIIRTARGYVGLTNIPEEIEELQRGYYLYELQTDFSVTDKVRADFANIDDSYSIEPYRSGFIVYDRAPKNIQYLPSVREEPQAIKLDAPEHKDFYFSQLSAANNVIAAVYTNKDPSEIGDAHTPEESGRGDSEVIVYKDGEQRHLNFNKVFSAIQPCGTNKLCAVSSNRLEVYDIGGKKSQHQYQLPGITELHALDKRLLAISATGVMSLDIDSQEGYHDYSFGDYQYCGWTPAGNNYVLCIIDGKGKRQALYISTDTRNATSIDKRVAPLSKVQGVKDVSVYDNYIFVSAGYGEQIYDPRIPGYTDDPARKQMIDAAIRTAAAKAGIDKPPFTFVNLTQ